jgi:hypothetical protein
LREVVCPVLELREEKQTFVKVGGGKVDFFQRRMLKPASSFLLYSPETYGKMNVPPVNKAPFFILYSLQLSPESANTSIGYNTPIYSREEFVLPVGSSS